jgi:hypothetical protein
MDYKKQLELIELQNKYFATVKGAGDMLPADYYRLKSVDEKKKVLLEAIRTNTPISQLDYMRMFHHYMNVIKFEEEIESKCKK